MFTTWCNYCTLAKNRSVYSSALPSFSLSLSCTHAISLTYPCARTHTLALSLSQSSLLHHLTFYLWLFSMKDSFIRVSQKKLTLVSKNETFFLFLTAKIEPFGRCSSSDWQLGFITTGGGPDWHCPLASKQQLYHPPLLAPPVALKRACGKITFIWKRWKISLSFLAVPLFLIPSG